MTPTTTAVHLRHLDTISLLLSTASVFLLEWGPFARLDLGGVERWMVYPIVLWLVGFGSYLAASPPAETVRSPLPLTATTPLDGRKQLSSPR